MVYVCDSSLPPDGITNWIYNVSEKSSIQIGLELNKCLCKLNVPTTPRNIETKAKC